MFVPSSTTQMLSSLSTRTRVRELEAVEALADLPDERAVLIELEQPRVAAARVDEDVPLGIGRDADAFAQVQIGRQLEEVRHRLVRDLGRGGFRLGARRHLLCRRGDGQRSRPQEPVKTR